MGSQGVSSTSFTGLEINDLKKQITSIVYWFELVKSDILPKASEKHVVGMQFK